MDPSTIVALAVQTRWWCSERTHLAPHRPNSPNPNPNPNPSPNPNPNPNPNPLTLTLTLTLTPTLTRCPLPRDRTDGRARRAQPRHPVPAVRAAQGSARPTVG
eukprot:scaffold41429_cov44-Phaeocystis_antarctica.AAC.2